MKIKWEKGSSLIKINKYEIELYKIVDTLEIIKKSKELAYILVNSNKNLFIYIIKLMKYDDNKKLSIVMHSFKPEEIKFWHL